MTIKQLEKELNGFKSVILKATRRENADFLLHVVRNKEMEKIRKTLMEREDFKGREAKKIASEEMVNVLSFPEPKGFPHPESGKKMLGEVFLNYDFGKGDFNILAPLFIHGYLHLLGYLHWTNRDTIRMKKLEKRLWEELISKIP